MKKQFPKQSLPSSHPPQAMAIPLTKCQQGFCEGDLWGVFGDVPAAAEAGCSPAEPSGPRKERQLKKQRLAAFPSIRSLFQAALEPLLTNNKNNDGNVTLTSRPDWNRAITPKKFPKAAFLTSFWKGKNSGIKTQPPEKLHLIFSYASDLWNKVAGRFSLEHPARWR